MKTYKVVQFDEFNGNITVLFDGVSTPITVDVPIDESGLYVTGSALDSWVEGFYPHVFAERSEKIRSGIPNADIIRSMVQVPEDATPASEDQQAAADNSAMWAQLEAEKMIARVLVKFGVLQSDPTEIGVTQL